MTRRTEKRGGTLANDMAKGKLSAGTPMPVEQETPNPLPDNYHPHKRRSFVDDNESKADISSLAGGANAVGRGERY